VDTRSSSISVQVSASVHQCISASRTPDRHPHPKRPKAPPQSLHVRPPPLAIAGLEATLRSAWLTAAGIIVGACMCIGKERCRRRDRGNGGHIGNARYAVALSRTRQDDRMRWLLLRREQVGGHVKLGSHVSPFCFCVCFSGIFFVLWNIRVSRTALLDDQRLSKVSALAAYAVAITESTSVSQLAEMQSAPVRHPLPISFSAPRDPNGQNEVAKYSSQAASIPHQAPPTPPRHNCPNQTLGPCTAIPAALLACMRYVAPTLLSLPLPAGGCQDSVPVPSTRGLGIGD
jgi:hypothetical protein